MDGLGLQRQRDVEALLAGAWNRWVKREVPLPLGRPEEIGSVAAFLLSPLAGLVTGAIVPVAGGRIGSGCAPGRARRE